jgi:hypothetical protein
MEINLHLNGIDVFFIALTVVAIFLVCFFYFRNQRVSSLSDADKPAVPLRKLALYAAFLGLGVLFVAGHPLLQYLTNLGVPHASPGDMNATGAEVEASATASGWVPLGTATSKVIMAATFYVLSYILPWVLQQVTHPQPTEWTKEHYKLEFLALPSVEKFAVVGRITLNQSIRWAGAVLASALIV